MKVRIGTQENGQALTLDIQELIVSRALIQANSGGGKSWFLRLISELCAGKVQTIIFDHDGEFVTLREKFDFALVGREGEVGIDIRSAPLLARKIVELNISAIINLSDLDDLTEKRAYVAAYLTAMMKVPRKFWHPILVIVDESHLYCPEKGQAESSKAVISLMDSGRKRGFAGVLATQRLSKLHKDAAAEVNNVFIGRTWLDNDQARAQDILGFAKKDITLLRDVKPGEIFAFGSALNVNGVVRFKSGAVQTTHPKAGERHTMAVPAASTTILAIAKQIEDVPQQAEAEESELHVLRNEVVRLRRLRSLPVQTEAPADNSKQVLAAQVIDLQHEVNRLSTELANRPMVINDNELKTLEGFIGDLQNAVDGGLGYLTELKEYFDKVSSRKKTTLPIVPSTLKHPDSGFVKVVPVRFPTDPVESNGSKGDKKQEMLDVMAGIEVINLTPHKVIVAYLTNQSPTSSQYDRYLRELRDENLILYAKGSDELSLTHAGMQKAHYSKAPASNAALHASIYSKLPAKRAETLSVLIAEFPDNVTRADLAARSGQSITSSAFEGHLRGLRKLGVIDYDKDSAWTLPVLFLEDAVR